MSRARLFFFLPPLIVFASCKENSAPPPAAAIRDEVSWRKELVELRTKNDAEMKTSPISPHAARERHILSPSGPTYVVVEQEQVRLEDHPSDGAALVFRPGDSNTWSWEGLKPSVHTPLPPGPIKQRSVFELGRFSLLAQPVEDTFVVTIYDSMSESQRSFQQLSYYDPDPHYAVTAELDRFADHEHITLPTSIGLKKTFSKYGKLRFEIGGKPYTLTAYQPVGASSLFIPFRDATSGHSTYGAGRYLDLEEPSTNVLLLDFNRAYSPMCSYSPAFNCPIPPVENHLSAEINAGEKTYSH